MNHFPKISKIKTLSPKDKVRDALALMESQGVQDLPCVEGKKFIGFFRHEQLSELPADMNLAQLEVPEIAVCKSEFLFPELWAFVCAYKTSFIPIESQEGIYLGSLSTEELVSWFYRNFCLESHTGYLVVLQMDKRDYSLSRLSILAEENNILIQSSMIVTSGQGEEIYVTLKTNSGNIDRWLETLDRQSIELRAVWGSDVQEDKWKERLNEFMHYLNV